jgi:hypothetical protein
MGLDERYQPETPGVVRIGPQLGSGEQGCNEKDRIGPGLASPLELHRMDDKVLRQGREPAFPSTCGQQLVATEEEFGLHHYRQGCRALSGIGPGLTQGIESALQGSDAW